MCLVVEKRQVGCNVYRAIPPLDISRFWIKFIMGMLHPGCWRQTDPFGTFWLSSSQTDLHSLCCSVSQPIPSLLYAALAANKDIALLMLSQITCCFGKFFPGVEFSIPLLECWGFLRLILHPFLFSSSYQLGHIAGQLRLSVFPKVTYIQPLVRDC